MTKRRASGEGSIYKRKDGRWAADFTIGRTSTGKRRRKTVYGRTQAEVLKRLAELVSKHVR